MFETEYSARIRNPLDLLGDESILWSKVSLRIHIPWFYVIYRTLVEDGVHKKDILLITNSDILMELESDERIEIVEVYLVSPEQINRGEHWKMEPVIKIFSGSTPASEQILSIYLLADGNTYASPSIDVDMDDIQHVKTIFEVIN